MNTDLFAVSHLEWRLRAISDTVLDSYSIMHIRLSHRFQMLFGDSSSYDENLAVRLVIGLVQYLGCFEVHQLQKRSYWKQRFNVFIFSHWFCKKTLRTNKVHNFSMYCTLWPMYGKVRASLLKPRFPAATTLGIFSETRCSRTPGKRAKKSIASPSQERKSLSTRRSSVQNCYSWHAPTGIKLPPSILTINIVWGPYWQH